jgi:hypothetical protein
MRGKPLLGGAHRPLPGPPGHLEVDLDFGVAAVWAADALGQVIASHHPPASTHQRFHVEFGDRLARYSSAAPPVVVRSDQKAADADAPAELPGFADARPNM